MADYIVHNGELYHYGVKGMKWGRRKAPVANSTSARRGSPQDVERAKAARKAKMKKALKIGAAVAGTALAAYGTYKLAKYMQDRRNQAAMQKAQDYVANNIFKNVGKTTFKDGTVRFDYANKAGDQINLKGARSQVGKALGQHNAKAVATGRQMYKDATNTRLDRGLAKIVNTGDAAKRTAASAGDAAKRAAASAGDAAKRTATRTKNAVLDMVNPIYENVAGPTTSKTRTNNGVTITETMTEYYRKKKRR